MFGKKEINENQEFEYMSEPQVRESTQELPPIEEAPKQPNDDASANTETAAKPEYSPSSVTVVGRGITFVGDFVSEDPIEIRGALNGNIVSSNVVHVAKDGLLYGGAKAFELQVDGIVEGTSVIKTYSIISDTGSYKGKLSTGLLRTSPDAFFEGHLSSPSMNKGAVQMNPITAEEIKQNEASAALDELIASANEISESVTTADPSSDALVSDATNLEL